MCGRTSALREEQGDEAAIDGARRQRGLQTTHTCAHFNQKGNPVTFKVFTTCILETLPCLRHGEGVEAGKTRSASGCRGRRFSGCPLSNTPPVLEVPYFLLQKTQEGGRPLCCPTPIPVKEGMRCVLSHPLHKYSPSAPVSSWGHDSEPKSCPRPESLKRAAKAQGHQKRRMWGHVHIPCCPENKP